eukprot:gene10311-7208_t
MHAYTDIQISISGLDGYISYICLYIYLNVNVYIYIYIYIYLNVSSQATTDETAYYLQGFFFFLGFVSMAYLNRGLPQMFVPPTHTPTHLISQAHPSHALSFRLFLHLNTEHCLIINIYIVFLVDFVSFFRYLYAHFFCFYNPFYCVVCCPRLPTALLSYFMQRPLFRSPAAAPLPPPHGSGDPDMAKGRQLQRKAGWLGLVSWSKMKWICLAVAWMLFTVLTCYVTSFLAMESFYKYHFVQTAGGRLQLGGVLGAANGTARVSRIDPEVVDIWRDEVGHREEEDFDVPLQDRKVPQKWTNCVYRMFRFNAAGQEVIPERELEEPIPLLITILMTDSKYLPRFLCSIDIPVRYWYLVLNGEDKDAVAVVDLLESLFAKTGRLIVHRTETNKGFAGSMNLGLRWGMKSKTKEEVPWFFVCNIDVAFGGGVLKKLSRKAHTQAQLDAPLIAQLEAEVREEEAMIERNDYSWYDKYVPAGRPLKILREGYPGVPKEVHTAALLPDRLRYMYPHRNDAKESYDKRFFSNHIGVVYPVESALPASAVTRLCVGTVGYMDENYHPIYMEDIDWRWRMFYWGFREYAVEDLEERYPNSPYFWHKNGANILYQHHLHPQDTEDNTPRWAYQMSLFRKGRFYELAKLGTREFSSVWEDRPVKPLREYRYFSVPYYPSDVYVTDPEHMRCFDMRVYDYASKMWVRPSRCTYNCNVLVNAGVLGVDQVKALDCDTYSYDDKGVGRRKQKYRSVVVNKTDAGAVGTVAKDDAEEEELIPPPEMVKTEGVIRAEEERRRIRNLNKTPEEMAEEEATKSRDAEGEEKEAFRLPWRREEGGRESKEFPRNTEESTNTPSAVEGGSEVDRSNNRLSLFPCEVLINPYDEVKINDKKQTNKTKQQHKNNHQLNNLFLSLPACPVCRILRGAEAAVCSSLNFLSRFRFKNTAGRTMATRRLSSWSEGNRSPLHLFQVYLWGPLLTTCAPAILMTASRSLGLTMGILQVSVGVGLCYNRFGDGGKIEVPNMGQWDGCPQLRPNTRKGGVIHFRPGEFRAWSQVLLPAAGSVVLLLCRNIFLRLLTHTGEGAKADDGGSNTNLLSRLYALLLCSGAALFLLHHTVSGVVLCSNYPANLLSMMTHPSSLDRSLAYGWEKVVRLGAKVERNPIPAPTGTGMLDSVMVSPPGRVAGRTMLYIGGNAEFMENKLEAALYLAKELQCNVVVYNPRGVGYSSSAGRVSHLNDLVDDAVAVAEYYIHTRLRANPRTFLLLGHSIGGGVAAEAIGRGGALRHCPLVVDRSFISMTAAAAGMTGLPAAVIQRAYGILGVGNLWTMRAWHRIEHDKKLLLYSRRDEIIRFEVASPGSLAVRRLGDAAPTSADARPPDGHLAFTAITTQISGISITAQQRWTGSVSCGTREGSNTNDEMDMTTLFFCLLLFILCFLSFRRSAPGGRACYPFP